MFPFVHREETFWSITAGQIPLLPGYLSPGGIGGLFEI